jgi:exodeoxyribonuclease-3
MRIGSWNVNSLRMRLEAIKKWLVQEKIDIALLQETKIVDELFPQKEFTELGYEVAFWGQKAYNGVAIISRWPLTSFSAQDFLAHGQARYIEALTNGVRVASIYVPNGKAVDDPAYQEKLMFMDHLVGHVAPYRCELRTTVLGGDFNIALEDEDVYDPTRCAGNLLFSDPERRALRNLVYQGWVDSLTTQSKKKNPFTWWDYRGRAFQRDAGLRIDYCFLSPWAADRLVDSGVSFQWRGEQSPSDHTPTWVELSLTP